MAERVDLEAIKAAADFAMVLENYGIAVPTTLSDQIKVHCPWHEDKRPSLSINLKTKVFRCFGCQARGNIFHFVVRMDEGVVDTRTAGKAVAKLCGVPLSGDRETVEAQNSPVERRNRKDDGRGEKRANGAPGAPERSLEANLGETGNKPLTFSLQNLEPDHPYFGARGLSSAVVEAFGLGWCNPQTSRSRLFAGWCVIPIHNEHGELVAYAGRWPGDDLPEGIEERYKLPPGFKKNLVFFGLHKVLERGDIRSLVIVEGYFSVFRLWELGIPAVALMGSSMSQEQLSLLAHLPDLEHVVVLMDGDEAGDQAARQIVPMVARRYFTKAPRLPDGEQPDVVDERVLLALAS